MKTDKIEIVIVKAGGEQMALVADVAKLRGYKEGDRLGLKEAQDAKAQNAAYLMGVIRQMDREENAK